MKLIQARPASTLLIIAMIMVFQVPAWAAITAGQRAGVDIGDAYGTATNWTLVTTVNGSAVSARDLTSGNVIAGVTVALSTSSGVSGVNDLSATAQGNSITTAPHAVTDDGAWAYDAGGTTLTLTFAGLDPALLYRIELYSTGTYTPLDTPYINGTASNWAAGFETRVLRKGQTTGAVYPDLVAVGGSLSIGIREVNPVMSGAILSAYAASLPALPHAVNTTNWSRTLAIQTAGYTGAAALTNFPLLVALNPTRLAGFSYADFAASGRDLRFTDASNSVLWAHEVESWNTNGSSQVWVCVPRLTSSTVLQAFWGNPDAPAPANANQVWDAGFRGIWHLAAGVADATTNANHGTNSGSTSVPGVVAQGRDFNGSAYVDCGNKSSLNLTTNQLTLSAWINPSQLSGNAIIGKSYYPTHATPYYSWILYAYPGGLHCRLDNTTVSAGSLTVGQWQHVAAVYNGSTVRLYVDGQEVGATAKTGNLLATTRNVRIGGRDTSDLGEFFYGDMDEVRVAAAARSADWIRAERDSVVNEAFCSFGGVLPTQPKLPLVTNPSGATTLLATSATLTGQLVSTGAGPSSVWICWGASDAGTNFNLWSYRDALGVRGVGPFSLAVAGLNADASYFYRCRATNTYGEAWSAAQAFAPFVPRLSVAPAQAVEGNSGQTPMRFVATLSAAYPQPVSFDYATAPGTASAADFQPVSGQATFPAGQTQLFIDVPINGNTVPQSDRYLLLDLGNAPVARITAPQVRGLILDDDRDAYLSPCAVVADTNRARLYVAEQGVSRVGVVDLNTDATGQSFPLPDAPNGLALNSNGTRLYVAAGVAKGRVFVLDALTGDLLQTLAVGHTPMSPAVSPDGARLYVCNRFNDDVSVIILATGATVARIPVDRQPHAAALTPDGRRLFVANLLPSGPATNPAVAGVVSVVDTVANALVATVRLPVGAQSLRGLCVSPDGAHVFVTHVLSRFYVPTTQVTRGWMNTAALSVIDAATGTMVNTVLLDDLDLGAANPWGVACTADGQYLCVAHAGTHEISVIDRSALLTRLQAGGADVPQDLTYLASLRRRLPLKGNGPRAIALVGTKLYAAEFFSDSVGAVNLAPGQEYGAKEIVVGWQKPATGARLGERHYNDATLCLQHWQSCASCHPDARSDSLNWDLINDGFGSPKNSKSHLYSMQTPPAMATGIRANAPVAVRAGFKYIEFLSQPEACAEAVDAFLTSLTPTPSPYLVNGALGAAATRGQAHFETQGCTQCHSGPYLTDGQKHDIGTATAREPGVLFDTPTLREIWRTAPYLHDGRAATVREVITTVHAARVSGLSETQIDDLAAYVLSL